MTARSTAKKPDIEVVLPDLMELMVAGKPCTVRRLKTREFLALLKVVMRGFGPGIQEIKFSTDDPEAMQGEILGLLLIAAPNAIDEFAEFLFSIVEPKNAADQPVVLREMANPDAEVLLDALTIVAIQERDDLTVLAGKAQAAFSRIQSVYRNAG